jgi:hypothetical protein
MDWRSMATDTKKSEGEEADVEATVDGGLCRLELPGAPDVEEDEAVAPRHEPDA